MKNKFEWFARNIAWHPEKELNWAWNSVWKPWIWLICSYVSDVWVSLHGQFPHGFEIVGPDQNPHDHFPHDFSILFGSRQRSMGSPWQLEKKTLSCVPHGMFPSATMGLKYAWGKWNMRTFTAVKYEIYENDERMNMTNHNNFLFPQFFVQFCIKKAHHNRKHIILRPEEFHPILNQIDVLSMFFLFLN